MSNQKEIPDFIEGLNLHDRLKWYQNKDLDTTWLCFITDIPGKIVNIKETQIHQIVYGPGMSNQEIRPLSKESLACLASLKPGPVPGFDAASLGLSSTTTNTTKHLLTLNLGEKRKSEPSPITSKRQKHE